MKRNMAWLLVVIILAGWALCGCSVLGFKGSNITAGKAQMILVENKSTKEDVIRGLGAPNIHYRRKDGSEMWTYESVATVQVEVHAEAGAAGGAVFPAANAAGLGFMNVGGSKKESSMRTLTLTVYFNNEGVVTSYETFESHF